MAGNNRTLVILQERDMLLLRELATMRVVDREQAKAVAGFRSTTRANTRLLALTEAGYLRRYFWGTVGGARKALYSLTQRGADVVGVPYRRPRKGRDRIIAVDSLAAHQLRLNEIYIGFKYPASPKDAIRLLRWRSFEDSVEQFLIPDGYAEMEVGGVVHAFFIEADLGTEGRVVWQNKVRAYVAFAASGRFAEVFGQPFFRTLAITISESRLAALQAASFAITTKIFRFTTFDRITRDGFWAAIWQKPTGERQSLL